MMVKLEWSAEVTQAWWEITDGVTTTYAWAEQYNASIHVYNGCEYLVFDSEADAIVFRLKVGV